MTERKAHQVDDYLAQAPGPESLVLVYGSDHGLVREQAERFAKSTNVDLNDPFCCIRLEATTIESEPGRLVSEATTISMFGGTRLVWVREGGSGKSLSTDVKALLGEALVDTFVLIEAGNLKKGTGVRALVEKSDNGVTLPCFADDMRARNRLIDQVMAENGLHLTLDARNCLQDHLGADRLASRGELEKLALYAQGKTQVDVDDVLEVVGDASAKSFDGAIDATLCGNLNGFDRDFYRLIADGRPPSVLLGSTLRQLQQLEQLRTSVETAGKSVGAVIASARPPIFFGRRKAFETQLSAWTLSALAKAQNLVAGAILQTRLHREMEGEIAHRTLLRLAVDAQRLRR